jgi:hypothetical protein
MKFNFGTSKPAPAETGRELLNGELFGKSEPAVATITKLPEQQQTGWRAFLPIHPAAEAFPLMSESELRELADDIEKNGLKERARFYVVSGAPILLDGRNRLDALWLLGKTLFDGSKPNEMFFERAHFGSGDDNAVAYVISHNIHRRHLTSEQKRDLVDKLLKLDPEKSDRQIAAMAKVHHTTVANQRSKQEGRGEIGHVETRTDTKGRKQPTRRKKTKRGPQGSAAVRSSEPSATLLPPHDRRRAARR